MIIEATWLEPGQTLPPLRIGGCYNADGPNLEAIGTVWAFVLELAPGTLLHSFKCERWLLEERTDDPAAERLEFHVGYPDGTFGHLHAIHHASTARVWIQREP